MRQFRKEGPLESLGGSASRPGGSISTEREPECVNELEHVVTVQWLESNRLDSSYKSLWKFCLLYFIDSE